MRKYYRKTPFDEKSFHEDILNYGSLYVFCYGYANLESYTYKDFMQSLAEDRSNYKVYFAPNKALAYSVGLVKELTPEQQNLKPGDLGYITKEFDTGLHEIGCMLDEDECTGVLLTNKNEEEVLSKFREYKEFDFVKPGSTPMETLKLGMPVKLSGQDIQLTERFVVCEVKKRVTEEASQILELLGIKMFDFVLLPMGCWIRTTKITRHFPYLSEVPCRD
ncbi:hypothetical protein MKW94_018060 [Papaver nudicaule]|uniref:Uncharacterized protein n=1 Tax=Papaver nudicaule TaxID=74823 RepID=A0AA42B632_PAPNU|nr:hypothetical protein [Papaver nudicaule]